MGARAGAQGDEAHGACPGSCMAGPHLLLPGTAGWTSRLAAQVGDRSVRSLGSDRKKWVTLYPWCVCTHVNVCERVLVCVHVRVCVCEHVCVCTYVTVHMCVLGHMFRIILNRGAPSSLGASLRTVVLSPPRLPPSSPGWATGTVPAPQDAHRP